MGKNNEKFYYSLTCKLSIRDAFFLISKKIPFFKGRARFPPSLSIADVKDKQNTKQRKMAKKEETR
jgi:hypothetical protein